MYPLAERQQHAHAHGHTRTRIHTHARTYTHIHTHAYTSRSTTDSVTKKSTSLPAPPASALRLLHPAYFACPLGSMPAFPAFLGLTSDGEQAKQQLGTYLSVFAWLLKVCVRVCACAYVCLASHKYTQRGGQPLYVWYVTLTSQSDISITSLISLTSLIYILIYIIYTDKYTDMYADMIGTLAVLGSKQWMEGGLGTNLRRGCVAAEGVYVSRVGQNRIYIYPPYMWWFPCQNYHMYRTDFKSPRKNIRGG